MKTKTNLWLLVPLMMLLVSCGKDDTQKAQDSLIGDWSVTEVFQSHNIIVTNGEINISQESFEGMLGTFHFTASEMDYEYVITDTIQNVQSYQLIVSKEKSGFVNVPKYEVIGDDETFRVRYGDQTSDAHCNATDMTLEKQEVMDSLLIRTILSLVKD